MSSRQLRLSSVCPGLTKAGLVSGASDQLVSCFLLLGSFRFYVFVVCFGYGFGLDDYDFFIFRKEDESQGKKTSVLIVYIY